MTIDAMQKILQQNLTEERFLHSLGVSKTAVKLAQRFSVDENKAKIAGLLHDAGRQFPIDTLIEEAQRRFIAIDEVEQKVPMLLHGKIGAALVKEIYGVDDEEIEDAIILHTTAGKNMSDLSKIIYVADMIEPTRKYPAVYFLRKVAEKATLVEIFYAALVRSLEYIQSTGQIIHPYTLEAKNELLEANPYLFEWLSQEKHAYACS